jgi:o-succinylbenzoate---CoA ligase
MNYNYIHLKFPVSSDENNQFQKHLLHQGSTAAAWQKDIYTFVEQWLNEEDDIIVYTSGSTGEPKAIKLKKQWMKHSAMQTCGYFGLTEKSTGLLCMPAAYIAGKMMIVRALVSGMDLFCMEPSGNPFKELKEKIDFTAITPFQLYQSLNDLRKPLVQTIIVGGGEISDALEKEIQLLPVNIYATYGMTETSSHVAVRQVNGVGKDDQFTVIGNTKISTDDRNCLVLENPDLFDGILATHDVIEMHGEKKFSWLGRFDNIINSGGIKIIPEKTEQAISDLRKERMIISSQKDDRLGEKVVLVIESPALNEEEKTTLREQIRKRVHPYSVPATIYTMERFPETNTGKIDRLKIREFLK